jgi:hypothetical protein
MTRWLWVPVVLIVVTLLVVIVASLLRRPGGSVVFEYPRGVKLAGWVRGVGFRYALLQWVSDQAHPVPCPLVLHLPGGDLGGEALCDWGAPQAAAELGAPVELDLFPFHDDRGKIVGIRVGLLPGCPAVEVCVGGTRLSLPISEEDAVRCLGEPLRRVALDLSGQPR